MLCGTTIVSTTVLVPTVASCPSPFSVASQRLTTEVLTGAVAVGGVLWRRYNSGPPAREAKPCSPTPAYVPHKFKAKPRWVPADERGKMVNGQRNKEICLEHERVGRSRASSQGGAPVLKTSVPRFVSNPWLASSFRHSRSRPRRVPPRLPAKADHS